jgi:fructokinase
MILVIGEALIDLIGHEGSSQGYNPVVGGANANVAMALARADVPHRFLARISGDTFGHKIRAHLESYKVDLSLSVAAAEQTTLAIATIDPAGVASYAFYINGTADWAWEPKELPTIEAVNQLDAKAVQFGCLTAAIEPGSKVLADWLATLSDSRQITLSHDLNIRPSLGFERKVELQRVLALNELSHIIKASDADIEWLFDLEAGADLSDIAEQWTSHGQLLIITRGAGGVEVHHNKERLSVHAQRVALVDTVGAGDTFMANFLIKLDEFGALGSAPEERLASLETAKVTEAIQYATAAAAIVCERSGCQPPTRAEVELRLKG